jgi:hypothetical protein
MPKGPQGQKRPADVIGSAVMVAKIATGELNDASGSPAREGRSLGGKNGGEARAVSLTPEQRSEIARIAAEARWKKS